MILLEDHHSELIGKLAKLSPLSYHIEEGYVKSLGIGNANIIRRLYYKLDLFKSEQLILIFNKERPIKIHNLTLYCLEEIGSESNGDYYWLTVDQLIICN